MPASTLVWKVLAFTERAYQHALWYAPRARSGAPIGDKSGVKKTILHHPDVRRMLMIWVTDQKRCARWPTTLRQH